MSVSLQATMNKPATNTPLRGVDVGIPARPISFDLEDLDIKMMFGKRKHFGLFLMTLSALFPQGEYFFVRAVKHYRPRITDPHMLAEIAGFIGQESLHSREHDALNELAQQQGIDIAQIDREIKQLLTFVHKNAPPALQLAITVSLEHFTAFLAEMLLNNKDVAQKFDPKAFQIWAWHALEENEHKSVAFNLYQQIVKSYMLRVSTMGVVSAAFIAVVAFYYVRLLKNEKMLSDIRGHAHAFNYMFGPRGIFTPLVGKYFDFYRPSFHPNDHDTTELLAQWREKLFGRHGELKTLPVSPQVVHYS